MDSSFSYALEKVMFLRLIIGMIVVALSSIGLWELGKYLIHHAHFVWK